jgi:hypothetical protein
MFREGYNRQDTTGPGIDALFLNAGLTNQKSDSDSLLVQQTQVSLSLENTPDNLVVCPRNHFAFITFADSGTTLRISKKNNIDGFTSLFIKSSQRLKQEKYTILQQQVKEGENVQSDNIYSDWILFIILASAFLFSLIRSTSRSIIYNIFKSISYLGFRNDISWDIGGLFHWQSTVTNLASFLNISLFIYYIQHYYNLITAPIPQILLWFLLFVVVIAVITLRHFVCTVTGNISEETEAFREYLYGIYQTYRLLGLILFVFNILISYTSFISTNFYFIAGLIIMAILYLFRIIRLLIIFINRNISKFYFILYLCALEILPVFALIKFFTGSK